MDYRVALDIYKGPLDLLLYLIQENELDITDIPIATITDQYMQYLELIKIMDPNIAGDFLVMASTLMEIKSRTLLPQPEGAEGEEVEGDPRIELIRQLMEYKKFKEAAALLEERREEQMDRFGRGARQTFPELQRETDAVEMSEVSIWDLLSAFERMMRETLRLAPTTIVDRDVPVRHHVEMILRMLHVQGVITFLTIFETCEDRIEAIGAFLALLEMTRARIIQLDQTADRTSIFVKLLDERNVPKLLQEISERRVGTHGAPEARESNETGARTPPAEEVPAEEPKKRPSKEKAARAAPAEPDVDEEADEELEKIRRIEIHEVDLDEKPTDPDSAPQERTDPASLAEEPTEGSSDDVSPDAGPPKRPIGDA
jgi:segregation and condensation protein A